MDKKKVVRRPYDNIKDVNESKDIWNFAVRIADAWSVMGKFKQDHFDMVMVDKQVNLLLNTLLILTSNLIQVYLLISCNFFTCKLTVFKLSFQMMNLLNGKECW